MEFSPDDASGAMDESKFSAYTIQSGADRINPKDLSKNGQELLLNEEASPSSSPAKSPSHKWLFGMETTEIPQNDTPSLQRVLQFTDSPSLPEMTQTSTNIELLGLENPVS